LSIPRPNRLFRVLDKLRITSKYGNVVAPDGSRFRIDFRSLIFIYEIYLLECYELLDGFRVARDDVVIDVGSNVGMFTVKAARESGEGGLVVSVEPHPTAFQLLRNNIAKNGLNNVRTVGAALGSKIGEANLVFAPRSTVGTFYDSILHSQERDGATVRVITLDSLVDSLRLETVDFLKIDVEGAEIDVLRGGLNLLSRGGVRRVVVETHGDELVKETTEFLTQLGYRTAAIDVFPSFFVGDPFPTVFALLVEPANRVRSGLGQAASKRMP
jgi:FkbM family methyltransferase